MKRKLETKFKVSEILLQEGICETIFNVMRVIREINFSKVGNFCCLMQFHWKESAEEREWNKNHTTEYTKISCYRNS